MPGLQTIQLFEAIKQMRTISATGGHFSMVFMSYSRSTGKSEGRKIVAKARLRSQETKATNQFSDHTLSFVDVETGLARRFWQYSLMYFNGIKVVL